MANYGLYFPDFSDMRVLRNWGIVERNGEEEMVLIDMGLTEEIYDNFSHSSKKEIADLGLSIKSLKKSSVSSI